MMKNKTLFLFGAGASAFSQSNNAPPLGTKLFSALERFDLPIAKSLDDNLKTIFHDDFERGMQCLISRGSNYVTPFQKELSLYISQFKPSSGNLYCLFLKQVKPQLSKAIFSTVNYDLLFELAAKKLSLEISYCLNNSNDGGMEYFKLHGSCNFLPQLPKGCVIQNNTFNLGNSPYIGPGAKGINIQLGLSTPLDYCEIKKWCSSNNNSDLAPVISAYASGKNTFHMPETIDNIRKSWKHSLSTVKNIYLVGIKYNPNDSHLWGPIFESQANIFCVDPNPSELKNSAIKQDNVVYHEFTFAKAINNSLFANL